MKQKASKICWGILLLLTAAALVLYGIGESKGIFGMPMHKMLFAIVLSAWIISKILLSDSLRERLKIFFPLGLLFMVLETEIAKWAGLPSEEIINNWIVLLASILADIAITVLIPRGKSKGKHFNFSFEGESDHRGFGGFSMGSVTTWRTAASASPNPTIKTGFRKARFISMQARPKKALSKTSSAKPTFITKTPKISTRAFRSS